jgi:hypothetical protein
LERTFGSDEIGEPNGHVDVGMVTCDAIGVEVHGPTTKRPVGDTELREEAMEMPNGDQLAAFCHGRRMLRRRVEPDDLHLSTNNLAQRTEPQMICSNMGRLHYR